MTDAEELKQRLRWIITLRWAAVLALLPVALFAKTLGMFSFSLTPIYAILGFVAFYNMVCALRLRAAGADLRRLAVAQIALDQVALALGVYFSGGCDSPFIYFFIFHIVISGIVLPRKYAFIFGGLAVLFPASVMGLKHWGVLPHYGLFRDEPAIFADLAVMAGYGTVFISTVFLTAYFVTYLSAKLHQSREELSVNNVKLATLLDASRLTTSTLAIEKVLQASLKIVLNVTNLKAGIILLVEECLTEACYDYFNCAAFNCPAYKSNTNCWRLSGTLCHGGPSRCPHDMGARECWERNHNHTHYVSARNVDEKIAACTNCEFFTNVVLVSRMVAGFQDSGHLGRKLSLDGSAVHRALVMGQAVVDYSRDNPLKVPFETTTGLAVPLKTQDQMIGILYLVSDTSIRYTTEEIEFFQLLSDVVSSGIFNSRVFTDMEQSYLQTVTALENAIEAKDPYTKGHSKRVADVSVMIAEVLNLSEQEKEHLRFAALLHDVGKIGISKDLLWKRCSLDECEEQEMRVHPDKGVQILEPVHFLKPVLSAIRHHHENFDGSGYPLGLKGNEIPFKARIIKVADAWDAMTSERPYRAALSPDEANAELARHAGIQFDPAIVEVFLQVCPLFPDPDKPEL
jgi:putative nucleotidyltransferase with HDIG domain